MESVTTGVSLDTTGLVNPHCPITTVEASAPHVDGSLPPLDVSAAAVCNQIRQEQIAAEQERVELVQQRTVEQIVHVPVPQIQEQIVDGVKEIPQERFPEQTLKQIENTPLPHSV